jgi:hypothetical protein
MGKRMRDGRPSLAAAALAVAVVALVVALVGPALGLPGRNRVNSGDIRNESVRSKDLRNGKAVARSDLVGDQQTRWALVNMANEKVLKQSGGISVDAADSDPGSGVIVLDFGTDLRGRALIVSVGSGSTGGTAAVTICGDPPLGLACPNGLRDNRHALVDTHLNGGGIGPRDFYILEPPL